MVSELLGDSAWLEKPQPPDFIKGRGCGAALQPAQLPKEMFRSQNICKAELERFGNRIFFFGGGVYFPFQATPQLQILQ